MLNYNNIQQLQHQLSQFYKSNEKATDFMVDCELKDRIKFIYTVIFTKAGRYAFYWRFFLSRVAYYIDYSPLKILLYRIIGIKIGKGVFISPQVNIDVHFQKLIQIDDYAILGFGCSIFTHDFYSSKYRIGRVRIGKGAVIGAEVIVACGVEIGEMANISVRSTIMKDVAPFYKSGTTENNV